MTPRLGRLAAVATTSAIPTGRTVLLLGTRGATLASRFLLLIVLASLFSPNEMAEVAGVYVLTSVIVGLGGFELHRDVGRRYVIAADQDRPVLLRNHLVVLSCFALAAGLLAWPLSTIGLMLPSNAAAVAAIIALQIVNADVTRFFIFRGLPLVANVHMLVATGSWILVFAPLVYLAPELRSAHVAFLFWIGSSFCGLLFLPGLGLCRRRHAAIPLFASFSVSVVAAIVPFAATGLMLFSNSLDRLVLRVIGQPKALNTVFFLVGILQVASIVVDVVVNQRVYPRLVRLAGSRSACWRSLRIVARTSFAIGLVTAPTLALVAWLLAYQQASIATENHFAFVALLCVGFILDAVVGQLVNGAYAFGFDVLVLKASMADFVITAVLAIVLLSQLAALGACLLWVIRGVIRLAWYAFALRARLRACPDAHFAPPGAAIAERRRLEARPAAGRQ